jgi:hypothetical protein
MYNIGSEHQQDKYRNHAQVWELLPWYINGSLSDEEKQQISEHTTVCLICRKELGLQSALRESVKDHELDEVMVTASFARLSAQLHDQDESLQVPLQNSPFNPGKSVGRFAGALSLWLQQQFKPGYFVAAMSVLAIAVILPRFTTELLPGNNTFRTLSNALTESPVAADLRVIFVDGVSISERDAILDMAGLSVVSGPDERGLYFVNADNVSASVLDATLKQLQGNENILFAEFSINTAPDSVRPGEQ